MSKVLLINGSPHEQGNTYLALNEAASALNEQGIETEILWIGTKPVRGCIACNTCAARGDGHCVFNDDLCNQVIDKLNAADGSTAWSRETGTGNCGVPAIDNLGYVYVTDSGKRRLLKLSPQDGSLVSQFLFENSQPRTSPTIDSSGNIYVTCTSINDEGAILYKLTCPRTTGPAANWSQLGGNQMKTCQAGNWEHVTGSATHEGYTSESLY